MGEIKESDWKSLRRLKSIALERLCRRILDEVGRTCAENSGTYHQRYLRVFSQIQRGDDAIAGAFNDLRRSNAIMHAAIMRNQLLINDDEFSVFSEATRKAVIAVQQVMQPTAAGGSGIRAAATEHQR